MYQSIFFSHFFLLYSIHSPYPLYASLSIYLSLGLSIYLSIHLLIYRLFVLFSCNHLLFPLFFSLCVDLLIYLVRIFFHISFLLLQATLNTSVVPPQLPRPLADDPRLFSPHLFTRLSPAGSLTATPLLCRTFPARIARVNKPPRVVGCHRGDYMYHPALEYSNGYRLA